MSLLIAQNSFANRRNVYRPTIFQQDHCGLVEAQQLTTIISLLQSPGGQVSQINIYNWLYKYHRIISVTKYLSCMDPGGGLGAGPYREFWSFERACFLLRWCPCERQTVERRERRSWGKQNWRALWSKSIKAAAQSKLYLYLRVHSTGLLVYTWQLQLTPRKIWQTWQITMECPCIIFNLLKYWLSNVLVSYID